MSATEEQIKATLGEHGATHWGVRIILAARVGERHPEPFTLLDRRDADRWVACACGDMYLRKPYQSQSEGARHIPQDDHLRHLAKNFSASVKRQCVHDAAKLLVKIEARGAELENQGDKR